MGRSRSRSGTSGSAGRGDAASRVSFATSPRARPISVGGHAGVACGRCHELRGIASAAPRRQLRARGEGCRGRDRRRDARRLEPLGVVGIGIARADAQVVEHRSAARPGRGLRAAVRAGVTESRSGAMLCVPSARRRSRSVPAPTSAGSTPGVACRRDRGNRFDLAGARHLDGEPQRLAESARLLHERAGLRAARSVAARSVAGGAATGDSRDARGAPVAGAEAAAALCRRKLDFVAVAPADMTALAKRCLRFIGSSSGPGGHARSSNGSGSSVGGVHSAEPLPPCLAAARSSPSGASPTARTPTRPPPRMRGAPSSAGDPIYRVLPLRHRLVLESGDFVMYDVFADGHTEVGLVRDVLGLP